MRVLLTGGAGFIGSHVTERLLRSGAEVAIIDNLDPFYSVDLKRANLTEIRRQGDFAFFGGNICDSQGLAGVFGEFRPDTVIHLAARAGVRPSIENPCAYQETNVGGTQNVLEMCRQFSVKRIMFGSSSSVYGESALAPFSEDQIDLRPISPYAATKLSAELLCHVYSRLFGLEAVCLRFFTVYGPRQRPDLAIHKFTTLIEANEPIPMFGDGSTGRDYTWCEDIAAGVLAALDVPLPRGATPFEIYNLGNSHHVTLNQLIEKLEVATGRRAIRKQLPAQPGDVPLTWADITKARRDLKYEPSTPLDAGLARFVAWHRRQQKEARAAV